MHITEIGVALINKLHLYDLVYHTRLSELKTHN